MLASADSEPHPLAVFEFCDDVIAAGGVGSGTNPSEVAERFPKKTSMDSIDQEGKSVPESGKENGLELASEPVRLAVMIIVAQDSQLDIDHVHRIVHPMAALVKIA